VQGCRVKGFASVRGDAHRLPFADRSFDLAYCSFLLLWLRDPLEAVREMMRVSRHGVLLLAEPDHGGRVDHPEALLPLRELVADGMRREGADPFMGRKLRALLSELGRDADIGIHPGRWDLARSREEAEGEWSWLEGTVGGDLAALKGERDRALAAGTLFHHSPVFYALARK
jgi:SAM-dependent methyltransferase